MPFYRSPLVPVTRGRSPIGWDVPGANWVLFGDVALLWTPTAVVTAGVNQLSIDPDEILGAAAQNRLTTLCGDGRVFTGMTLRQAIVNILKVPPVDGRWGGLRASKIRRRLEVWLGPGVSVGQPLFSEPAAIGPSSKTFVDDFNRGDGNLDGSTSSDAQFAWLEVDGTAWQINGNTAHIPISSGFCTARANADLDTGDHYAQFTIANWTRISTDILFAGPLVRWTGANGYGFEAGNNAGTPLRRIYRYDNDANLATDATNTESGTWRLEVDGSSLTALVDGAPILGPITNTQWAGQLRTGISAFDEPGSSVKVDNFEAGDLLVTPEAGPLVQPHFANPMRPRMFAPGRAR